MRRRRLGRTGLYVSEVAFGCVEIGIPYGIGVHSPEDMLSEEQAVILLRQALASGINFFDTARMYGRSEAILGKAFAHCREEVIIATKVAHLLGQDGVLPEKKKLEDIILRSLEASLDALQTDYVDLLMLHQGDEIILQSEAIRSIFSDLKKAGKIKAAGVSTYTNRETELAIDLGCWNVIQIPFNMMDQRQLALFAKAKEADIALVLRSVLLKGLLGEKAKDLHPALSEVEAHIKKFIPLAESRQINLATLATRFALSFEEVSSILVGIDKQEYLEQSLLAAGGNKMDEALQQKIKTLAFPDPAFIDLPKWDRQGWLK